MTISSRLQEFLDDEGVKYEVAQHPAAYTALEIAEAQHIPGKNFIKAVIVKSGDTYMMAVLPSTHRVNLTQFGAITRMKNLELATEEEIYKLFPDYQMGAEPPFGHLYGLKIYIDHEVKQNQDVYFNAGTHTDVVKMNSGDFLRLSQGALANIAERI